MVCLHYGILPSGLHKEKGMLLKIQGKTRFVFAKLMNLLKK